MPKKRATKKREKKTQHKKFVALARESGADDGEALFAAKVRAISSAKPKRHGPRKK
jgi:hypothetical protein